MHFDKDENIFSRICGMNNLVVNEDEFLGIVVDDIPVVLVM